MLDAWIAARRVSLSLAILVVALAGAAISIGGRLGERPLVVTAPTAAPRAGAPKAYVSGEVVQPGVYSFEPGDRVEQLVALAGGFSPDADVDAVNLALRLKDEQQVHIPRLAASAPAGTAAPQSRLIDLNSASSVELESLPGVGPVTAQLIVDHRTRVGPFTQVEDLLTLKLVSRATFEKVKALVTVR
jgi:competence protein ComEA